MENISVLFVCTANICRSPTAQAVLRTMLDRQDCGQNVTVSSAGTHPVYPRSPPDTRSLKRAALRGYDLSHIRAKQVSLKDYDEFHHIIVMDDQNLKQVQIACPPNHQHKLHMLAEFCSREGVREIPDPYYGGIAAFELALDLIEDACSNLVVRLMNQIATQGSSL